MKRMRNLAATAAFTASAFAALALLPGCGDKKAASTASAQARISSNGEKVAALPSVAGKLARYQLVDYGKEVDRAGFSAFHDAFMRSAAAASNFDKTKFAEMAFVEVGSETDAFKRDDKAKALRGKVDKMADSPTKFLRLTDSSPRGGVVASVGPYDMAAETYTVRFSIDSLAYSLGWDESPRHFNYRYRVAAPSISYGSPCVECSRDTEVVVKVPKDRAREIEARLSPLRGSGRDAALVSPDFYVSVDKILSPNWERAEVGVNIDAVALRIPGKIDGEPLIFIDGPEFKRK